MKKGFESKMDIILLQFIFFSIFQILYHNVPSCFRIKQIISCIKSLLLHTIQSPTSLKKKNPYNFFVDQLVQFDKVFALVEFIAW